jgi:hypothetical protein
MSRECRHISESAQPKVRAAARARGHPDRGPASVSAAQNAPYAAARIGI